jgi:stage II sporulation protein P
MLRCKVTNLSIKKLNWLLIVFSTLFIALLIYIASIMVNNNTDHPIAKIVITHLKDVTTLDESVEEDQEGTKTENESNNATNPKPKNNVITPPPFSTKSGTSEISANRISEELTPDNESIHKDASINQQRINKSLVLEMKTPKIDSQKFHSTFGKEVAYIYFSHNRESFLPYFNKGTLSEEAYHSEFNITLIGERLGKALKYYGVWNSVDDTDIINMLDTRGLNFNSSYQMSRELVLEENRNNRNLDMLFDIHRDSLPKKYTTHTINDQLYAKISFVIGSGHTNYKKNLDFANSINDRINKAFPGLSRGVIIKDTAQGNGVYNQDLSPNSVIIEIGGVDNTIDELYRTADVLGYVISEYYWEKVH